MLENLVVVPDEADPDTYIIVGGEHRWRAARVLGMATAPCLVRDDWDADAQRFVSVKLNVIRGKLDPLKFIKMVEGLRAKYGQEVMATMMGFADQASFNKLYRQVKRGLPREIGDRLDKVKSKIRSVDELASVLNELISTHGSTIERGYMFFTYSGQTHLMVMMDGDLRVQVDDLAE